MTDYLDNGGASRDRTDDPLLAKQVLSQLSYGPVSRLKILETNKDHFFNGSLYLWYLYLNTGGSGWI
jgi:hypothetical protein